MAITIFVDTYLTLADANQLMISNNKWNEIALDSQKENYLKAATAHIDTVSYSGVKADDAQALKFPRLYSGDTRATWTTAGQTERLERAMVAQVEYLLSQENRGRIDMSSSQSDTEKPLWFTSQPSWIAITHLRPYLDVAP